MRLACVASLALLACRPHARPAAPSNVVVEPPPPRDESVVEGIVREEGTREPVIGATIVAAMDGLPSLVAYTDEHGAYSLRVPQGHVKITVYYSASVLERELELGAVPARADFEIPYEEIIYVW